MERVKTEWFFFLHSDVELLKGSFKIMISKKGFGRGIIESNRLYLHEQTKDLNFLKYIDYNDAIRAYSGYQLIRKKAIEPILAKIDDDYIYRNEDLIFQSECLKNGFEYKKCWALHIHQVLDQKRTFDEYETHVMQVKGLIKYSNPTKINERTLVDPLRWCKVNLKSSYNFTLNEMLRFCYQNNPNWAEIIIREWNK
ncbi:MAG: hypothetical protein OEL89_00095 [Candidatus Peregrinibacteria bacterium]|nr:hypothetical protein [Candidatus Peregrinibacteria bacterium]